MRVDLTHWICAARGCGQIAHTKLGGGPDDCPSCGCSSWGEPTVNFASGISLTDQRLPDSCPVCRAAKAAARNAEAAKAQLGLFVEVH